MGELRTSAALVAALVVVLGGCADDAPQGDPEIIQVEPSEESPSEAPGESEPAVEEPPAMPAAAKKRSYGGAEAFVRHWVDAFNFSTRTGTTEELRLLSKRGCETCNGSATLIEEVYQGGGRIESNGWKVRQVGVDAGADLASPSLAVRIKRTPEKFFRAKPKRVERFGGGAATYSFELDWQQEGSWVINEIYLLD